MQKEIQNRSVVLTTKAARISARALAAMMKAALRQSRRNRDAPARGRQTVRRLSRGGALQNVEITDENIKSFQPFARKYGVDYALQKDASSEPPRWLVFFKSKDVDAMTAAFKEFSAKTLTKSREKPSTLDAMEKFRELLKRPTREKVRHKTHGEHEL
ncbi:MAG: PcfB family protein [Clostridiales bacterium]|nr:PcfB family protein [Clostridiales bacterium]